MSLEENQNLNLFHTLEGHSTNMLFLKGILLLNKNGLYISNGTKELVNVSFSLNDPKKCYNSLKDRKLNLDYPLTEFIWYITGDKTVDEIKEYAKLWDRIKDDNGEVESNYGYYLFCQNIISLEEVMSQWDWCLNELYENSSSRRCIFNILQPYHKIKNSKDLPCTSTLQFIVRNNKLHLIVNMRSQDFIYGWCNDIACFALIQQMFAHDLSEKFDEFENLSLGRLFLNVGSLHIYEKHYRFLDIYNDSNWAEKYDEAPLTTINLKSSRSKLLEDGDFISASSLKEKTEIFKSKHIEIL
jgi:thymidylate synthase